MQTRIPFFFFLTSLFFGASSCEKGKGAHMALSSSEADQVTSFFVGSENGKINKSIRLTQDGTFLHIKKWKTDDGIIKLKKSSFAWISETTLNDKKPEDILASYWLHVYGEQGSSDYIVYLPNELIMTLPLHHVSQKAPLWLGIFTNDENGDKKERFYPFMQKNDLYSVDFSLLERDAKWLIFSSVEDPRKNLFPLPTETASAEEMPLSSHEGETIVEGGDNSVFAQGFSKKILSYAQWEVFPLFFIPGYRLLDNAEILSWKTPLAKKISILPENQELTAKVQEYSLLESCNYLACFSGASHIEVEKTSYAH